MNSRSYKKLSTVNDKMDSNTRGNTAFNSALEGNQSGVSANPSTASKPAAHSQIPVDFSTRGNTAFNGTLERNQSGVSANPSTASKPAAYTQIPSDKKPRHKKEDPAEKTYPSHATNRVPAQSPVPTSTSETTGTTATPTKATSRSMKSKDEKQHLKLCCLVFRSPYYMMILLLIYGSGKRTIAIS